MAVAWPRPMVCRKGFAPKLPPLLTQRQNVAHGTLHRHLYSSKTTGGPRAAIVYTPPQYDANTGRHEQQHAAWFGNDRSVNDEWELILQATAGIQYRYESATGGTGSPPHSTALRHPRIRSRDSGGHR